MDNAYTHCSTLPSTHDDDFIVSESDAPDSFARFGKLSDKLTALEVKKLHAAVVATSDEEAVVKLHACDTVVVGAKSM